jgi:ribosomal protein S27AE
MSTIRSGICPRCDSRAILANADTTDEETLSIQIYEKPGVVLRGRRTFPIKAWVCTECGYTELYVTNPDALAQSCKRSRLSFAH